VSAGCNVNVVVVFSFDSLIFIDIFCIILFAVWLVVLMMPVMFTRVQGQAPPGLGLCQVRKIKFDLGCIRKRFELLQLLDFFFHVRTEQSECSCF